MVADAALHTTLLLRITDWDARNNELEVMNERQSQLFILV